MKVEDNDQIVALPSRDRNWYAPYLARHCPEGLLGPKSLEHESTERIRSCESYQVEAWVTHPVHDA